VSPEAIAVLVVGGVLGLAFGGFLWMVGRSQEGCRGEAMKYAALGALAVWALAILAAVIQMVRPVS